MKKKDAAKAIASVVEIATAEVKKNGVCALPGFCRMKTRKKPATKAGTREVFGKARAVIKAFPVAAFKKEF
eukprot:CAMPEP_0204601084 /NCGR_PEP_ID=MMETSP0661-20131031/55815_1 /ASSEMBLY_ACC=CAM_ASM_000606 /TAXON_ID=109239 /ORGANISM="Alexandrium margalefi, Strain AMGDE01CS-322" /LENGTH=70 /DNA_ID=CAMNT_0051611927 /DNA_START=117 /DNA_END=329 /DNA_ORIENTATION=+